MGEFWVWHGKDVLIRKLTALYKEVIRKRQKAKERSRGNNYIF